MLQMNSWQAFAVVQHLAAHRDIPTSPPKSVFQMLAKKVKALQRSDFRPKANIRVFYGSCFHDTCLDGTDFGIPPAGRISWFPMVSVCFRQCPPLEELLLTANMFLDKTSDWRIPVWIVSLDVSEAFDRVQWDIFWRPFADHSSSDHLV